VKKPGVVKMLGGVQVAAVEDSPAPSVRSTPETEGPFVFDVGATVVVSHEVVVVVVVAKIKEQL
jgi:hypothetical protein